MLTSEQLKVIEDRLHSVLRESYVYDDVEKDIRGLFAHIKEITQKSMCEHEWAYLFNFGFKCHKCDKTKETKP
jgi:hypothetical protein